MSWRRASRSPQSELALTVRDNPAGWVIGDEGAPTLTALIEYLATPDGQANAAQRGARAGAAAVERYSLDAVLRLYAQEFRALLRAKGSVEPTAPIEEIGIGASQPVIKAGLRHPSQPE